MQEITLRGVGLSHFQIQTIKMGLLSIFKRKKIASEAVSYEELKKALKASAGSFNGFSSNYEQSEAMTLLSMVYNKGASDVVNQNRNKGEIIDPISGINYRTYTTGEWQTAMRSADQRPYGQHTNQRGIFNSWVSLFDIFGNMAQDAHVKASIDTLLEGVQSRSYQVIDKAKKELSDHTEMLNAQWFADFIEAQINAYLYGFSLVSIDSVSPHTGELELHEVNRKHVRPDIGGVVKMEYDQTPLYRWNEGRHKRWNIFTFRNNLGALNPCVRWYIYKMEVARVWALYTRVYGLPTVVGKTDIHDTKRRQDMIEMMRNFVKTRFVAVHQDDEIEQMHQSSSGSQGFFENLIRLCDEQISKALIGSTMVLDNGSSRSQSEVHQANTNRQVKALSRRIEQVINRELFPRLRMLGVAIPQDARFRFVDEERLDMAEKAQIVATLANAGYEIDAGEVTEFVGLKVSGQREPQPTKETKEREEGATLNVYAQSVLNDYKKKINVSDGVQS